MPTTRPSFDELGRTGLPYTLGKIRDEFLPELQGTKGIRIYREMKDNDPIVGAVLFAIDMLIRGVPWRVDAGGDSQLDQQAADLVRTSLDDMSMTWPDVISEILSMLPYGWAYHEIVYKYRQGDSEDPTKRSKHNDGLIGWRKLPIRSQESFWAWEFDDDGGLRGLTQRPAPTFQTITIPIERALLFRTRADKNSPEGRSVLRNAFRPWWFKRRIEEIEGVGIERDLAGLPVLTPPEGVDLWNPNDTTAAAYRAQAEAMVRSVRRDENEGVVKPFGWDFVLLTTGGRRNFDTSQIIERYDRRIAMTVMADFILMGGEKVGSYALSQTKSESFQLALRGWLTSIRDVFNTFAIPRLVTVNGWRLAAPPTLQFRDVDTPNLTELGAYLEKLFNIGFPLFPNKALETYMLQAANLPEPSEDEADEAEDEGLDDRTPAGRASAQRMMAEDDATEDAPDEADDASADAPEAAAAQMARPPMPRSALATMSDEMRMSGSRVPRATRPSA